MARRAKFPTLAILLLIFALVWFFSELGYIQIHIPWIPLILIVASIGWIINRYTS